MFKQQEQFRSNLNFLVMKNKNQDVYSLIQGIEAILSKNRCSLSDDEKVLLENCLTELRKPAIKVADLTSLMEKIAKWLLLYLELSDHIKDIF